MPAPQRASFREKFDELELYVEAEVRLPKSTKAVLAVILAKWSLRANPSVQATVTLTFSEIASILASLGKDIAKPTLKVATRTLRQERILQWDQFSHDGLNHYEPVLEGLQERFPLVFAGISTTQKTFDFNSTTPYTGLYTTPDTPQSI